MEEHRSPAHAKPEVEQPPQQQQVPVVLMMAVAVDVVPPAPPQNSTAAPAEDRNVVAAPAATENGTAAAPAENGRGGGGGSELLGGPRWTGLRLFVMNIRSVFKLDEVGAEVLGIAVPASLALTADPLASLIDTAFIGRLGSVEIASVGVAIAVFNQVMKVCIYPLVSVTTSFVAEEDAKLSKGGGAKVIDNGEEEEEAEQGQEHAAASGADLEKQQPADEAAAKNGGGGELVTGGEGGCAPAVVAGRRSGKKSGNRRFVPSVTSALIVAAFLGLFQTVLLVAAGKPLLRLMGVKPGSPMVIPALRYLTLRALGAPAVLLSLAMQGVFRGFKDTKTPLYAIVAGDAANIVLDPVLIFGCRMGVVGAAIAHVLSQYLITLIMLSKLVRKVDVVPPSLKCLKFRRFLGCGTLLLARVVAVTFCVTLAASLAARHGPTAMAAFQICTQVWLATSLLADGLAVAGQAMIASAFAKGDRYKVAATTARVLQLGIVLGAALTALLGVGLQFGAGVFTSDAAVIETIRKAVPFVAGTQTLNTLAFVFDGVNFGASDYAFSAYSMIGVAAVSIPSLVFLSAHGGFVGIWVALAIYMGVRALASTWRMAAAQGPWKFLRQRLISVVTNAVAGDAANIVLDPVLIFGCRMGVVGAAIAHVLSQYLITLIMLSKLVRKVDVIPPSLKCLKFRRFLGCGTLLLARVVAVTFCVTLAASLAARHGPTAMAAFQICTQVWLATSLLADGLAVAGQAMIASAFAKGDRYKVAATTARVLQLGIVLGAALTALLGLGLQFGAGVFTSDATVIETIRKAVPFVAGTQTLNTLAFVFDGVNFGASDYAFSAYSMIGVAAVSIPSLVFLSSHGGFVGIWVALAIYMGVRALASTWRMAAAQGPWKFLRQ